MKFEKGYSAKIDERFSIHIASDNEAELNEIVKLNVEIHREEVLESFIRRILTKYPFRDRILFLYIKDNEKNRMVSSICLAPLDWVINGIKMPICEMEFVGTLEEYRGRGFIKILNELYEKIMHQKGYILSVIRGIPFYYRSLGYEFVSSLDERITIPVSQIPEKENKHIKIRKATDDDLALIESNYSQFHKKFFIYNIFNPECFKFKYLNDQFNSEIRSSFIFEENGVTTNYFSLGMSYDNENYEINSSNLNEQESIALLQFIRNLGNYKEPDNITLSVSEVTPLYTNILSLGGKPLYTYGWQLKIQNLIDFFNLTKSMFEHRLKQSNFKDLTKILRISDYQSTFELEFEAGILRNIDVKQEYPNPQITDVRVPGSFLFKLVLGDRTINELNYIIKDAMVNPSIKTLIETMFPKQVSLFSSNI